MVSPVATLTGCLKFRMSHIFTVSSPRKWKETSGKLKMKAFTLQSPHPPVQQWGYLLGKKKVNTVLLDCPTRLEELFFIYIAEICKVKDSHSELFLFALEILWLVSTYRFLLWCFSLIISWRWSVLLAYSRGVEPKTFVFKSARAFMSLRDWVKRRLRSYLHVRRDSRCHRRRRGKTCLILECVLADSEILCGPRKT